MLPCSAGSLDEIGLTRCSRAGAHSRGSLITHCFLLYNILSNGRRLCRPTRPRLACSQAAFDIIAHVKWTTEELRRDAIPFHEKITALFSSGDERYGIRLDFYLQPSLICDVAQRLSERNVIQLNRDAPPLRWRRRGQSDCLTGAGANRRRAGRC